MTMALMVTLKHGPGICDLSPLPLEEGADQARVVGGTVGRRGDILQKPPHLSWQEAAEELAPGRTELSPFDLELIGDSVTRFSYLPEGGLETLLRLSEDLETTRERDEEDPDELDILSRLAAALNMGPAGNDQRRLRRRKGDAA